MRPFYVSLAYLWLRVPPAVIPKGQSAPSSVPVIQFQTTHSKSPSQMEGWGFGYSSSDFWTGTSGNTSTPTLCFHLKNCWRAKTDVKQVPWSGDNGCEHKCLPTEATNPEMSIHCGTLNLIPKRWWNGHRNIPKYPDLWSFSRNCILMKIKSN